MVKRSIKDARAGYRED